MSSLGRTCSYRFFEEGPSHVERVLINAPGMLRFRVYRVSGLEFRDSGLGVRLQGLGFRV